MKVVIRVDASLQIGTGHVMRCMTLALELKKQGASVEFICRKHIGNLIEYIQSQGFITHSLASNNLTQNKPLSSAHKDWLGSSQKEDAELCRIILEQAHADWLIVDHYALDLQWEKELKKTTKSILVIDDLADREHECEILLDQNLYINKDSRYLQKVPTTCKLLLGPSFALLRDEFVLEKQLFGRIRSGIIKRILVFFGGVDAENHTSSVLKTLISIKNGKANFEIDVVIGLKHPFKESVEIFCKDNELKLHIQTTEMAKLINSADLAIGAGGITTYERLYLRLPSLLHPTSFNQIEPLMHMNDNGIVDIYSSQEDLKNKLLEKLNFGNVSPPDCVENGKSKIVKFMNDDFCSLLDPKPFDVKNTYRWIENKELRQDFMLSQAPLLRTHFQYWRSLLSDSKQRVYSICHAGKHIGNCGLKDINYDLGQSELWLYIGDPSFRGKGLGKLVVLKLLEIAETELSGSLVLLHVSKKNLGAIRLYEKVGFYELKRPLSGRWVGKDDEVLRMEKLI